MDAAEWEKEFTFAKPAPDQPIVVYCRSGKRSASAKEQMESLPPREKFTKCVVRARGGLRLRLAQGLTSSPPPLAQASATTRARGSTGAPRTSRRSTRTTTRWNGPRPLLQRCPSVRRLGRARKSPLVPLDPFLPAACPASRRWATWLRTSCLVRPAHQEGRPVVIKKGGGAASPSESRRGCWRNERPPAKQRSRASQILVLPGSLIGPCQSCVRLAEEGPTTAGSAAARLA
jgi:hypothetical protein